MARNKNGGMGSHQSRNAMKTEWLTPPSIIEALGPFDLDPCAPIVRPWDTAKRHLTIEDDGLKSPWLMNERIWMNPPYDNLAPWFEKLTEHSYGSALIFARTETDLWKDYIWDYASAVMFLHKRISFYHVDGSKANAGAPSAIITYGYEDAMALKRSGLNGKFIPISILNYLNNNKLMF